MLISTMTDCNMLKTNAATTFITINEVTTVAANYALSQFIGNGGVGAHSYANTGLVNAFATVGNLVNTATGTAWAMTPNGNGIVPQTEINTLADILVPCVNSTDPTSASCASLFSAVGGGVRQVTVLGASLAIAQNPSTNVATLFGLSSANAAFQPTLSAAPNDWTIALNFTGGGLSSPSSVAIDGLGDAWIANDITTGSVTELSSTGAVLNSSPLTGGGLQTPSGIAIDLNGNVWISNNYNAGSITELSGSNGAVMGSSPFTGGGVNEPYGIAIDGSDNVWTANFGEGFSGSVSKFTNGGVAVSGSSGYGTGMEIATGIAIDPSGNAWDTDLNFGNLDEVNNSGTLQSGFSGYTGGSSINNPTALAFDSSTHVWVATHGSNLRVLSDTGTAVGTYTGGGLGLSQSIAIDGAGNAWIANRNSSISLPGQLSEFSNGGTALTPSTGYTAATMINPSGIAIDGSGNVWVTNNGNSTVSEFIGAGVPVVTPLSVGVKNSTLGTRP